MLLAQKQSHLAIAVNKNKPEVNVQTLFERQKVLTQFSYYSSS